MSYSVTCWSNTGFNPDNIPDSPTLLEQGTSYEAIEVLQDRDLPYVDLHMTWEQAKNIDVVKVGSCYYYVMPNGRAMLNTDTVRLTFAGEDAILGIGGVNNIELIDGITERCHLSDTTLGDKSDVLLAPNEPMELETVVWNPTEGSDTIIVAETTCDAPATFRRRGVAVYEQAGETVYVPQVQAIKTANEANNHYEGDDCNYAMPSFIPNSRNKRGTACEIYGIIGDGINAYNVTTEHSGPVSTYSHIREAVVDTLFGLGMPNAVSLIQYPETLVDLKVKNCRDDQGKGDGREIDGSTVEVFQRIVEITGKSYEFNQAPVFKYLANTIKNDLLHVSNFASYGVLTSSGASAEYKVSQIRTPGTSLAEDVRPTVKMVVDPNPDGKPYYRFKMYNGNSSNEMFMVNALPGMSWKELPLIFTGKVGGTIDKINTQMTGDMLEKQYYIDKMAITASGIKDAESALIGGYNGYAAKGGAGVSYAEYSMRHVPTIGAYNAYNVGQSVGEVGKTGGRQLMRANELHRATEMIKTNYFTSQIATPTVKAPYQSEPLRNILGNGCIIYRYKYTANDAARIDKLITMFGCQYVAQLNKSMFTSRRYFNYIKASNVSCTGHSIEIDQRIAEQLSDGVRIWHVKPNKSYYETENI